MSGQQEALRLAQALEYCDASVARQAINELRRLHTENASLSTGYDAARLEIESLKAKAQEQEELLAAIGAGGVEPLRKSPVTGVEFSQFLSDVMTAAGLVEHGKQCKALATRLGDTVMRLRVEPPPKADHFRDATKMVSVGWAISYDGKTPHALWTEGEGDLLDLEVKRQGGTACKMALYAMVEK